jgi:hypothetical protein
MGLTKRKALRWGVVVLTLAGLAATNPVNAATPFASKLEARIKEHPDELHLYYYRAVIYAGQKDWQQVGQALDVLLREHWNAGVDITHFGIEPPPAIARQIAALQKQAVRGTASRLTAALGERDLIPEGISFDPKMDSFLLGSIQQSKVVRVSRDGVVSQLVAPRSGGLDEVLGLKADVQRRWLWVASVSPKDGSSAIVRFDLDTGRVLGRHQLHTTGANSSFNDLCLAEDRVFATETAGGILYEIEPEQDLPRALSAPGRLWYPNGIACDRGLVWVSDAFSLHAFELRTMQLYEIVGDGQFSGAGMDGLVVAGDRLVGVQNSFGAGRIIELTVDFEHKRITAGRLLEGWRPEFGVPTTGVVVDGAFHYIANSQFPLRSREGALPAAKDLRDVLILNLPLR